VIEFKVKSFDEASQQWIAANDHYIREETLKQTISNQFHSISNQKNPTALNSASHILMLFVMRCKTLMKLFGWTPFRTDVLNKASGILKRSSPKSVLKPFGNS